MGDGMAELVCGVALSHSPVAIVDPESGEERATRFFEAQAKTKQWLEEQEIDVYVVISNDHFRTLFYNLMPSFLIGIGECTGLGDWEIPPYPFTLHQGLAKHLLETGMKDDFDFAFSMSMKLDHGHAQAIHFLDPELKRKIVPVLINAAAPPLPSMRRCYQFGKMLRKGIESWDSRERVAIIASGGLSHSVPRPSMDSKKEEDRKIIHSLIHGRSEEERKASFKFKPSPVNEQWDRQLIRDLERDSMSRWIEMSTEEIGKEGGNGGQEIRNWVAIRAAAEGMKAETVFYEPIPEWLTGMGIMKFTN